MSYAIFSLPEWISEPKMGWKIEILKSRPYDYKSNIKQYCKSVTLSRPIGASLSHICFQTYLTNSSSSGPSNGPLMDLHPLSRRRRFAFLQARGWTIQWNGAFGFTVKRICFNQYTHWTALYSSIWPYFFTFGISKLSNSSLSLTQEIVANMRSLPV